MEDTHESWDEVVTRLRAYYNEFHATVTFRLDSQRLFIMMNVGEKLSKRDLHQVPDWCDYSVSMMFNTMYLTVWPDPHQQPTLSHDKD